MTLLLSLKAVAFDVDRNGFYSPSQCDFVWPRGVVERQCDTCNPREFDPGCHCGIYSSPNPEILTEYAKFSNTVYVLLNLYGWIDLWTGPADISDTFVIRSWGAKIIGVLATTADPKPRKLPAQRQLSAILGVDYYGVDLMSWLQVKEMITITWENHKTLLDGHSPFKKEPWEIEYIKGDTHAK